MCKVSIVIPAKNESVGLGKFLPELISLYSGYEVIVVDDGSEDDTAEVAALHGASVISHVYSKGNGAAIKSGARAARGDVIVFMDGDGQHDPKDVQRLLEEKAQGFDLVVGARKSLKDQANIFRGLANKIYNKLASIMVGQNVEDLTSGMRVVDRKKFLGFLSMLPNGFSYPTTSTMAFFRTGYSVGYIPIIVGRRVGRSHINIWRDGIRFFLIIFKIATLYSPLKLFFPLSVFVFFLGLARYFYTYSVASTFTNMSATLFSSSLLIFLIGLVAEQITTLIYLGMDKKE